MKIRIGAFVRDSRKLRDLDSNGSRSSKLLSILRKKRATANKACHLNVAKGWFCLRQTLALHVEYSGGKWILPTTWRFHRLYMRPNKEFISYRLHVVSVCYIRTWVVASTVWRFIIRFIIFITMRNIFMWTTTPFPKLLLQKNKVMRVSLYSEECRKIKHPIMCTIVYVRVCTHDCILDKKFQFTTVYPQAKSLLTVTDPCWHAREAMMCFNAGNHFLCGIAAI